MTQIGYSPVLKSISNSDSIGRDPQGPLASTYPVYKDMSDNNVIFAYKGIITSDLVSNVLSIMEDRLEEDKQDSRISKKVFNVMVESLNTLYADESELANEHYDPTALLMVKKQRDYYIIVTGTQIPRKKVHPIKRLVDRINSLDHAELKANYQEFLIEDNVAGTGVTMLGIMDLARKSKHALEYTFKYLNPEYSYFSLEARILSKNSI